MASREDRTHGAHRGAAQGAPGEAGGLPLPWPERHGALRRQGEVAPGASALLLPRRRLARRASTADESRRPHRGRRHEYRDRGLPPRAEPHQPPPAAVQRPPRDDKSYPYIAVTVDDDFPRVMFTRERHRRGVVYFGPYANAKKVRETLDVLNRVFRFRPCEGPQPGRHSGHSVPRLPHRPLPGALRRLRLEGGLPRDHRRRRRFPLRRDAADPARARGRDARRVRAAGLRGGGALA